LRLGFDDACWCRWSNKRRLLLHDGEGDVECPQRLAEEALGQQLGGGGGGAAGS